MQLETLPRRSIWVLLAASVVARPLPQRQRETIYNVKWATGKRNKARKTTRYRTRKHKTKPTENTRIRGDAARETQAVARTESRTRGRERRLSSRFIDSGGSAAVTVVVSCSPRKRCDRRCDHTIKGGHVKENELPTKKPKQGRRHPPRRTRLTCLIRIRR